MQKLQLIQGSKEWLSFRLNCVTATDAAPIAGIKGAFNKRTDVLADKLGRSKEVSEYQKKLYADGHAWEEAVRPSFENFTPVVIVSSENPRFMASLDGINEELKMILEIKSVTTKERFKEYCERIPEHYMAQVQWQLMCANYSQALIAFVHDGEVVARPITANKEMQSKLKEFAIEFLRELDAIKNNQAPAPIQLLSNHDMTRLAHLKKTQAEMNIQLDMIEEEIKSTAENLMKECGASKLESDDITISFMERQGSIDYKRIPEVEKLGDSYLQSFRGKSTRSLQVKLKK